MKTAKKIYGRSAPAARVTKTAAILAATALSVPVFVILTLIELALS